MTVNENPQDRIIRTLVGLTVTVGAVIMAAAVPGPVADRNREPVLPRAGR